VNVVDGGKIYSVVFPDGTSINPGYRIAIDPSYPGIGDDFRRTFHTLEMLKPDIWLSSHTVMFDFEGKRARAATEGAKAWVDPEGYRLFVAAQRGKFEAEVNKEMGTSAKTK
jgi:metallo-beta-lactamase class B